MIPLYTSSFFRYLLEVQLFSSSVELPFLRSHIHDESLMVAPTDVSIRSAIVEKIKDFPLFYR
jgi:hypothetical protein